MKIQPLSDKVLVKPFEEQETKKGGIIIPDTAKEKPQAGKVIAVGPGKRNDQGKLMPVAFKPGDRILYGKYSGTEVKLNEELSSFMWVPLWELRGAVGRAKVKDMDVPVYHVKGEVVWGLTHRMLRKLLEIAEED